MSRQSKPHPSPQHTPGKEKSRNSKWIFSAAILPVVGVTAVFASDIAERAEETLRQLNEAINQAESSVGGEYSRDDLLKEVEGNVSVELENKDEGDPEIRRLRERIHALQKDIKRQTSGDPTISHDTIRTLMDKQDEVNSLKKQLKELEQVRGLENDPSMAQPAQVQKLKKNYDKLIDDRNKIQKELFDLQKEHDKELQKLRRFFEQQYLARINSEGSVISYDPDPLVAKPKPSHPIFEIEEPVPSVQPEVMDDLEAFLKEQGAISDDPGIPGSLTQPGTNISRTPQPAPVEPLATVPAAPPETLSPEPKSLAPAISPIPELKPLPAVEPQPEDPALSPQPEDTVPPVALLPATIPPEASASTSPLSAPPVVVEPDPALLSFTNVVEATVPTVEVPKVTVVNPVLEPAVPVSQPGTTVSEHLASPEPLEEPTFDPTPAPPTALELPATVQPAPPVAPSRPVVALEPEPQPESDLPATSGALAGFQFLNPVEPATVNLNMPTPAEPTVGTVPAPPGALQPEPITSSEDVYVPTLPTFLNPTPEPPAPPATVEPALPSTLLPVDPAVEPEKPSVPVRSVTPEPKVEGSSVPDPGPTLPEGETLVEIPVKPVGLPDPVEQEPSLSEPAVTQPVIEPKADPVAENPINTTIEKTPALEDTLEVETVEYLPTPLVSVDVVQPITSQDDPLLELLGSSAPPAKPTQADTKVENIENATTPLTSETTQPVAIGIPSDTIVEDVPEPEPPVPPAPPAVESTPSEALVAAKPTVEAITPAPSPMPPAPPPALPETDFSIFDEPVSPSVAPPPAAGHTAMAPNIPAEVEEIPAPKPPSVTPSPIQAHTPPPLELLPPKATSEEKVPGSPVSPFPFFLNDAIPPTIDIYDLSPKKSETKPPADNVPAPIENDLPQEKEESPVAEKHEPEQEVEPAAVVEVEETPVQAPPKRIKRTPPSSKSTVIMQIKAEVEFLSGDTSRSDNVRPAGYTEFYITSSDLNDIIRNTDDLKETMDKAMVGKNLSSYAELWARAHKYGYNYPGLSSQIRRTLRKHGMHRIRTNANGEAKLRVSRELAEDEDQGELYIIGVARLGKVGVVWSKPFFIQDHAGHDNPVYLEDIDAIWLQ